MIEIDRSLSVLIADDSGVVRERLAALLREVPGVSIVAETETVAGTLEGIRRLRPAVVVLDINMPGGSGLDVLRRMGKERLQAVVIVLTNFAFPEYEQKARALGASAFLNKSNEFMKVADLVRDLSEQISVKAGGKDKSLNVSVTKITEPMGTETRVQELNRLLLAIREINKLLAREGDPKQLLADACNILMKSHDYPLVWIGLTEADGKRVAPAARAGRQAGYLDEVSVTWDESITGQGPVGMAIRTGRAFLCQNTATDPWFAPWRTPALARGLASVAAVPMIQGDRVLGALAVCGNRIEAFHEEEVALLNEVAEDLAFALESIGHEKERRRAEESLRQSEEEFRAMFEVASIGMAQADPHTGHWLRVNQKMCAITGYSAEELLQMRVPDLTHPEDRQRDWELFQSVVRGEVPDCRLEKRCIRKDGVVAWMNVNMSVIRDAAGHPTRTMAAFEDITERRASERRLRQLSRAVEQTASTVVITDLHGNIEYANPRFIETTGYSLEEALGKNPRMLKSGSTPPAVYAELWHTITSGQTWRGEFHNKKKNGEHYWECASVSPVHDEHGVIRHFVAVKEDITQSKLAQDALGQSEERFRTLFELAPDGIYLYDFQGNFVDGNKTAEELVGYARTELIGRSFLSLNLLSGSDLLKAATSLTRNVQGEATGPQEYVLTRKDGRQMPVEIRTFPVKIRDKALVLGVARDISERKQLETQLRQSQKMEGIGQLAGGVAHDFNNLLAVMLGNADLLLMDAEHNSSRTNECLKHIAGAAERAASLTRQLLLFSRKQTMQSRPVMLNELVTNLTKMLKRVIREDIRLECHSAEQLPFIQADPGMMEQVLLNLVINARDSMSGGGKLLITTEGVGIDTLNAQKNPDARAGEFICLSVADTGAGIAPENLQRIFEPFFTTKESGKGTGLGLATVYGIVKQHQGWIEVSSRVGEGSCFKIFLPAIPPPANAETTPVETQLRGGSETILLVATRRAARKFLSKAVFILFLFLKVEC